jgi:peroxin-3
LPFAPHSPTSTLHPFRFTASILPLTTADEELVLLQGGIPTYQAHVDISLREILDENLDIVARSHDFDVVFAACVDRATKALLDSLREGIFHEERVVEVFEGGIGEGGGEGKKVKLASVLPCIARWSHLAVNGNPNEVVEVRLFSLFPSLSFLSLSIIDAPFLMTSYR